MSEERKLGCDCLARVNEFLAEHNTQIKIPLWTASGLYTPFVETEKKVPGKRGKPKAMFASFCPFCGVEYPRHTPKDDGQKELPLCE